MQDLLRRVRQRLSAAPVEAVLLRRFRRVTQSRLLLIAAPFAAGVILLQSTARGLVGVLLGVSACGAAARWGSWVGAGLASGLGSTFLVLVLTTQQPDVGEVVLSALAVPAWVVLAWFSGAAAAQRRRVSGQLHRSVELLHHQALHDPLTGVANRDLLVDRLEHALLRRARHGIRLAVLYLGVDRFRTVNERDGHPVGDDVLRQLVQRLRSQMRGCDTVARVGGDEFVLLCEDLHDDHEGIRIAERIIEAMRVPFAAGGRSLTLSASLGVAHPGSARATVESLLHDADLAMDRAKQRGGGRFEVYDEALRRDAARRLSIETDLRRGIERDELRLLYQPIIDLRDGSMAGAEALIRWEHPVRGLLSPAEFIPVAEAGNLIVSLGEWVLHEACRQAADWNRGRGRGIGGDRGAEQDQPGLPPVTMAVNVSLRQLTDGSFRTLLTRALDLTRVEPATIHLEVTETALVQAGRSVQEQLRQADREGIHVGLDDFGTGYSSLSLLNDFPVRFLKIDRSFIRHLGDDVRNTAITNAVIGLGDNLKLATIAEGIETPEQLAHLRTQGCRYGQGYHLGRPQRAEQLQVLLDRPPTWAAVTTPAAGSVLDEGGAGAEADPLGRARSEG